MSFVVDVIDGKTQNDTDFYSIINGVGDTNSFVAQPGDLKVTQSASPGLSVLVATGRVYLYVGSKLSYFGAYLNTATTLTIGSNSSGSTRIDLICVKFDTGATSNTAGDNIVSLQVVAGTPGAGVPATPANYYKIAEASVINGAAGPSHIVNSDITDKRNWQNPTVGANQFAQIATPSLNPVSGANKLYFKSDNNLYSLTSGGAETKVNSQEISSLSGFGVYLNGAQSVAASNVDTKVAFDTKEFDLGTEFDIVTNHRFTATSAGTYLITFTAFVQGMSSGEELFAEIFKNGALAKWHIGNPNGNLNFSVSVSDILQLSATDYIEFYLQSSHAATRTIVTGANATYASGQRLS